jgi:ribosomal protein S18 acetylase RimI-like enzyme
MPAEPDIRIQEVARITPEVADAVMRLTAQLSSSARRPTLDHMTALVSSPATVLLIARDAASIIGMLTLVLFRIPTGIRALIEDVVVEETARGRGVGEALTLHAIDRATHAGARTIDLTSRPDREAANRLYQRLGFRQRDSNVYRYEPGRPGEAPTS